MPRGQQLLTQLAMVVNAPVEHHRNQIRCTGILPVHISRSPSSLHLAHPLIHHRRIRLPMKQQRHHRPARKRPCLWWPGTPCRVPCLSTHHRHHRLRTAPVVDDAQPPMHERDIYHRSIRPNHPVPKPPLPIRAAMPDRLIQHIQPRLRHRLLRRHSQRGHGRLPRRCHLDDAADPAHTASIRASASAPAAAAEPTPPDMLRFHHPRHSP